MAQVKVYGTAERLSDRIDALSDVVQDCLVDALGLPAEKRFHRFFPMPAAEFRYPADRTADYTIIEILMFEGRAVDAKKALYRRLFERFEADLGIAPNDLEITIVETPRHDWGIRGLPGDELSLSYRVGADD